MYMYLSDRAPGSSQNYDCIARISGFIPRIYNCRALNVAAPVFTHQEFVGFSYAPQSVILLNFF